MNHVFSVARAECTQANVGRLRIAAEVRSCKSNPQQNTVCWSVKASAPLPSQMFGNVRQCLAKIREFFLRKTMDLPASCPIGSPPVLLHGFRAGAAEVHFVYHLCTQRTCTLCRLLVYILNVVRITLLKLHDGGRERYFPCDAFLRTRNLRHPITVILSWPGSLQATFDSSQLEGLNHCAACFGLVARPFWTLRQSALPLG